MSKPTSFGRYLRRRRLGADLTLREVAAKLGITRVYLGEVERGVRATLPEKYWPKLVKVVPDVTMEELARENATSKPIQMDLSEAPEHYTDLAMSLARRVQTQSLSKDQLSEIMRILRSDDDE